MKVGDEKITSTFLDYIPGEKHLDSHSELAEGNDLAHLIENTPLSAIAKDYAVKELNTIKLLDNNNNEKADHLKYLQTLLKLPWGKYDNVDIDLTKAIDTLEQGHYGLEEVKNRIIESLIFMTRSIEAKAPIVCLVGPPGVGKTSIARSIANALSRQCVSLSLAGANDVLLIRGSMRLYRSSTPGKIMSLITEGSFKFKMVFAP